MAKVSIIVPVYNVKLYIETCLESIMEQNFKDFELILVDDRGSDNSMELARGVLDRYVGRGFRVITQPENRGISAARNTGTAQALGEYIYYVDSDDYIAPGALQTLVQAIEDNDADVVIADFYNVTFDGKSTTKMQKLDCERVEDQALPSPMRWVDYWPVMATSPWNTLVKRSLLEENKIDFTEGVIYEDQLWGLKLLFAAREVVYLREPTYCYRIRDSSLMRTPIKKSNVESWVVFCEQASELLNSRKGELDSARMACLSRAVNVRKVNVVKHVLELQDVNTCHKIDYIRRAKRCGNRPNGYDREPLPPFTRVLSYALNMPPTLGYWYARMVDKLPHKR